MRDGYEWSMIKKIRMLLFRAGIGFKRITPDFLRDEIYYINGSETLPAPLSPDREAELIAQLDNPDSNVKKELIEHNLRLVVYIARKFENPGTGNIEDLISIGTIGLIKAVNSFNPEKNIKLATYASRCIENEILMFLRKNSHVRSEVSIEEPLNIDWDGNELLLGDVLGTGIDEVSKDIESEMEIEVLNRAINRLTGREKQIMQLRFGLSGNREYTQKEVADLLGISQSYISRLEKKILNRLRKDLEQYF